MVHRAIGLKGLSNVFVIPHRLVGFEMFSPVGEGVGMSLFGMAIGQNVGTMGSMRQERHHGVAWRRLSE